MKPPIFSLVVLALAVLPTRLWAGGSDPAPEIHLVWMGGNDCPPCVAWRATELPKLQGSAEFKYIHFSYVTKTIKSAVPPKLFLPSEVVPLKEKLDEASSGRGGSPKGALFVNGEVYDFFQGTRSADEIRSMIRSVVNGTAYPFKRCLKLATKSQGCEIAA